MPGLLPEAIAQIQAAMPDLVVVTGDLVDHPFEGMDEPAILEKGERDLHLVREILQGLDCPLAVLYGNHDHPELFRRVFSDQRAELEVNGFRVLSFFDGEGAGHVPERVGEECERFYAVLDDKDPRPQIHLQHYLVAPERNEGYPHTYGEARALKDALCSDSRVRLVLSGHYHGGEALFKEGPVSFAVAPAFCQKPHPYRFYEVDDGGIHQREEHLR